MRIRCHLRRSLHLASPSPETLTVGGITLDDDARAVTVNDEPVSLTPLEYDILKFLMQHPCKVFSPQEIYRQVWREPPAAENSVAVHIRHIREKIEVDPSNPRYVTVVWGRGIRSKPGYDRLSPLRSHFQKSPRHMPCIYGGLHTYLSPMSRRESHGGSLCFCSQESA